MKQAARNWASRFSGLPLCEVDVIAHSTGGLVTRTYIQSDAYRGQVDADTRLPGIDRFVMFEVPNQGAVPPWNALHNAWGFSDYSKISWIFRAAFNKFRELDIGEAIEGPDYDIHPSDVWARDTTDQPILDGEGNNVLDLAKFIRLFSPTLINLLPTFPFIDRNGQLTDINTDPIFANKLALDLNARESNSFIEQIGRAIVIAGDGLPTAVTVEEIFCGEGVTCDARLSLTGEHYTTVSANFYREEVTNAGDGTVAGESLVGQFVDDQRVTTVVFTKSDTTRDRSHVGIVSNRDAQRAILELLGVYEDIPGISTGSALIPNAVDYLAFTSDPVEAMITDANGKRLGYSQESGVLTEIPGSVYGGREEGVGFVAGDVAFPLRLDLKGLGGNYLVEVRGYSEEGFLDFVAEGTLDEGEEQSFNLNPTPDVTAPQLFLPNNQVVEVTSPLATTVEYSLPTAVDDFDPKPAVECSHPSGFGFRLGTTTVTCTVMDLAGNGTSGSFLVTVENTSGSPWQNPTEPRDVDWDGFVAPKDVLIIVNELNNPRHHLSAGRLLPWSPAAEFLFDVNGDDFVSAVDALIIINFLNAPLLGEGDAPSANPDWDQARRKVEDALCGLQRNHRDGKETTIEFREDGNIYRAFVNRLEQAEGGIFIDFLPVDVTEFKHILQNMNRDIRRDGLTTFDALFSTHAEPRDVQLLALVKRMQQFSPEAGIDTDLVQKSTAAEFVALVDDAAPQGLHIDPIVNDGEAAGEGEAALTYEPILNKLREAVGEEGLANYRIESKDNGGLIVFSRLAVERALDVNGDGSAAPIDVLIIINQINASGPVPLRLWPDLAELRKDVNNDGHIAPIDALVIINYLNSRQPIAAVAEGESSFFFESVDRYRGTELRSNQDLTTKSRTARDVVFRNNLDDFRMTHQQVDLEALSRDERFSSALIDAGDSWQTGRLSSEILSNVVDELWQVGDFLIDSFAYIRE